MLCLKLRIAFLTFLRLHRMFRNSRAGKGTKIRKCMWTRKERRSQDLEFSKLASCGSPLSAVEWVTSTSVAGHAGSILQLAFGLEYFLGSLQHQTSDQVTLARKCIWVVFLSVKEAIIVYKIWKCVVRKWILLESRYNRNSFL